MKKIVVTVFIFAILATGAFAQSLVYWSMWNETESQGQVIRRAAEAFTRETGIRIEINFNGRDIRRTLRPALETGVVIDMFDEDLDRVNSSWANYLLPLDSYIGRSYPTTGGVPYSSVVHKALLDVARRQGGGQVKTIPYQPFIFTTMYNKDLFNRAGIYYPPKNWDQFLDACAKLRKIGVAGITVDDAYMGCLFGYTMNRLVGLDACRTMVDRDDFSGPAVLEFGRIWEEMAENGYIIPSAAGNVWPAGQYQDFATGRAAMYLNGTWLPNEIRSNAPDMKWGSFAWPAISPNGDGIEANNFSAQCFGINRNSRYPEEAFRFIVYLTTGQWDNTLAAETLGIPAGTGSKWPAQLAEAEVILENTTTQLPWAVCFEDKPEINARIIENFSRLIRGDFNARQFADAMRR
jgi:raffinose/stachyose/melibiose transport system substrate-binding protein